MMIILILDKKTQSIKFKKQIYIPFDVSKNTHLKGLKLCVFLSFESNYLGN
jgi:hypothetical protein